MAAGVVPAAIAHARVGAGHDQRLSEKNNQRYNSCHQLPPSAIEGDCAQLLLIVQKAFAPKMVRQQLFDVRRQRAGILARGLLGSGFNV